MRIIIKFVAGLLFVATTIFVSPLSHGQEVSSDQTRKFCLLLKTSDKRAACLDAVSKRGQEKQSQQPSTSGSTDLVHEIITLKGIPFGVPSSIEAIEKLCIKKSQYDCNFEDMDNGTKRIMLPDLGYGSLSTTMSYIEVDTNGAMVAFYAYAERSELRYLVLLLTEKYGKPSNDDRRKFVWIDQLGTRITILDVDTGVLSRGYISIKTYSHIKAEDDLEKNRANTIHDVYKSKL